MPTGDAITLPRLRRVWRWPVTPRTWSAPFGLGECVAAYEPYPALVHKPSRPGTSFFSIVDGRLSWPWGHPKANWNIQRSGFINPALAAGARNSHWHPANLTRSAHSPQPEKSASLPQLNPWPGRRRVATCAVPRRHRDGSSVGRGANELRRLHTAPPEIAWQRFQ